jgi:hypothetical protein
MSFTQHSNFSTAQLLPERSTRIAQNHFYSTGAITAPGLHEFHTAQQFFYSTAAAGTINENSTEPFLQHNNF